MSTVEYGVQPEKRSDEGFSAGDVVSYTPDERFDRWWCREGRALADEHGQLVDTYWGSTGDRHVLTPTETATAALVFNVADYDELDEYQPRSSCDTWEKYAPQDRQTLTSQHGLQVRWFIRKGAAEDWPTKVQTACNAVAKAEAGLSSAQSLLDWKRRELDALIALPVSPEEAQ